MSCKPGDLVGIPFPYSDLKADNSVKGEICIYLWCE